MPTGPLPPTLTYTDLPIEFVPDYAKPAVAKMIAATRINPDVMNDVVQRWELAVILDRMGFWTDEPTPAGIDSIARAMSLSVSAEIDEVKRELTVLKRALRDAGAT